MSDDGRQPGRISKAEGHLFFFEEVLICLFQDEGFFDDNAAAVFDHEGCQFGAVNEDKAYIDAFGVVAGVGAETRRGDEHSAAGLGADEIASTLTGEPALSGRPPTTVRRVSAG